jgi:hypothetical protein
LGSVERKIIGSHTEELLHQIPLFVCGIFESIKHPE